MARQAKHSTDVRAAIYGGRRYPCVCRRQFEDNPPTVNGENVTVFRSREGLPIAEIICDCGKRWTRVSA